MTWKCSIRAFAGLVLSVLLSVLVPSAGQGQKLPPSVAAAANPVNDGQALIKQKKYPEALAKFGEAQGATTGISQPTLRLFYQVTARLGSATALDGMQRYDAAFEHCDWANQTVATPAARQIPNTLRAAVHHMCGVILYHQKRTDEAKAFFEQAAKEGDKTAADWRKAVSAPPPLPTKPEEMVARADEDAQSGKLDEALLLYLLALQHYDTLGDKTAGVMERALAVALRMDPPPPVPDGAGERLKAVDAAIAGGVQSDLEFVRDLMTGSVIQVPWWGDGWKRLADVEEKLGALPAARGALRYYLKATPKAADRDVVEQRIASLGQRIASGAAAPAPAPAAAPPASASSGALAAAAGAASPADFDGGWAITQVCPPVGNTLGYSSNFTTQVSGGAFHAEDGAQGQPGFWSLDGKIAPDGAVLIKVTGLIGNDQSRTAGNAQPGTPFGFDVVGRIAGTSGTGKRMSARACDWTFLKQAATPSTVADISGNWSTTDGRIVAVKQNGNQVSWSSCCKPGHEDLVLTVSGTFDGKQLVGTYHYREGQAEGSGVATYTLSGDRLEGVWQTPDGKTQSTALVRHPGEAPGNLGGKWTTAIGRTVSLSQAGDQVRWTTCCRQAHPNWTADITATFDGKNLIGTYHWRDGDQQGNGTVSYTLNGNQLQGTLDRPGKEPYRSLLTPQADGSISGKWKSSLGSTLTLTQKGNDVTGTNCCRPDHPNYAGDVSGAFDGKNFVGVFHYRDGDAQGMGTFIYALNDAGQLEGSFKPAGGEEVKSVLTRQ